MTTTMLLIAMIIASAVTYGLLRYEAYRNSNEIIFTLDDEE